MARFSLLILLTLWTFSLAEEAASEQIREPRGIRKRCRKYGICPGGFGGQGFYGGHQGGFGPQGYPPINIGISQSQSSANAGGGGFGQGYYPNNNGGLGHGGHGYPGQGYLGYPGQGYLGQGYPGQGYQGYPGYFGNGPGAYNNHINGNYYGPNGPYQGGFGGFGYQRPFGNSYDEGEKPVNEYRDYDEKVTGNQNDES